MPLQRRLPKRGFRNYPFRVTFHGVNVARLAIFEAGTVVDIDLLKKNGIAPRSAERVKILGEGELPHQLTIKAQGFSKSAIAKIEAAGGRASAYTVDVADDQSVDTAVEALAKELGRPEILVNCAGVLEHGHFVKMPAAVHDGLIDLNVSGLTAMLSHFLPPMVERGQGRILNVASIAAFQPVASLATYAATKAYVLSLTESLSEELTGTGVSITALCPGVTATNMVSSAQEKSGGLKIPSFVIGDVKDVAAEGYRACQKGQVVCVPGAANLAATVSGRAMPKWLLRRIWRAVGRYSLD